MPDSGMGRSVASIGRAEAALLALYGFESTPGTGEWIDTGSSPFTRYDSTEDALDEVCARAEQGELPSVGADGEPTTSEPPSRGRSV